MHLLINMQQRGGSSPVTLDQRSVMCLQKLSKEGISSAKSLLQMLPLPHLKGIFSPKHLLFMENLYKLAHTRDPTA